MSESMKLEQEWMCIMGIRSLTLRPANRLRDHPPRLHMPVRNHQQVRRSRQGELQALRSALPSNVRCPISQDPTVAQDQADHRSLEH